VNLIWQVIASPTENVFLKNKAQPVKGLQNAIEKIAHPQSHAPQWAATIALLLTTVPGAVYSQQLAKKPNILVIMGDDIGWFNASCYNHGMMGYQTPNIDRIAAEGGLFNCWYGQQSCTAGRAAFVTGQSPIRTGLTKVG
jgi:hypothetical protein